MTFWGSLAVVLVTAAIVFLSSTTVILAAVDGSDEDWVSYQSHV